MIPSHEPYDDSNSTDNIPTALSIAAARAAQRREREEVLRTTGIQLTSDGRIPIQPRG